MSTTAQRRRRIVIFGNSGAGKTTLARAYAGRLGIAHLDLDRVAWKKDRPGVREDLAVSHERIAAFLAQGPSWVVEGCYTSLLERAAAEATDMVFLNPGVAACQRNCRSRPWEPEKYSTREAQDRNLAMLLEWVAQYETRDDEFSLRAHRALFLGFPGRKIEWTRPEAPPDLPMPTPLPEKSSPEEIRARFDADVERFSDLETGQSATIDAPLSLELTVQAALAATPRIDRLLDVGCGAGNYSLKLLRTAGLDRCAVDLCDLSQPMLERAYERVSAATTGAVRTLAGDIRDVTLKDRSYDVILAGAVLHHLREDHEWEAVFSRLHALLRPGGSLWITDLVWHEIPEVQAVMWARYGDYLRALGGRDYEEEVFAYIDREDSPRPVTYQLELLRKVGFGQVELLHKNASFAAFGGKKSAEDAPPPAH